MATYKTRAIILSSYPYKEHDRIVSFFSEHYGRLEARARGTRKLESKLAGHLEPFIETELLLAHGRHWDILAGSRTLEPRLKLRSSFELVASASLCTEAVKLITKPLAPEPRVWRELSHVLTVLDDAAYSLEENKELTLDFLWKLLCLSGFAPELEHCISCRVSVGGQSQKGLARRSLGEGVGSFSFEGGGVLCQGCSRHDYFAAPLSADQLSELRQGKSHHGTDIVISFWRRVVDYAELKSWNFFRDSFYETAQCD